MAAHAKAILLADCLEDAITEVAYQAELVGLHSHVSYEDPVGLELSVSGFSAKLASLATVLFQARPPPGVCPDAGPVTTAMATFPVSSHSLRWCPAAVCLLRATRSEQAGHAPRGMGTRAAGCRRS